MKIVCTIVSALIIGFGISHWLFDKSTPSYQSTEEGAGKVSLIAELTCTILTITLNDGEWYCSESHAQNEPKFVAQKLVLAVEDMIPRGDKEIHQRVSLTRFNCIRDPWVILPITTPHAHHADQLRAAAATAHRACNTTITKGFLHQVATLTIRFTSEEDAYSTGFAPMHLYGYIGATPHHVHHFFLRVTELTGNYLYALGMTRAKYTQEIAPLKKILPAPFTEADG